MPCLRLMDVFVGRTSSDLIEWRVCRTLLTDDTGFTPADSATYTGFE